MNADYKIYIPSGNPTILVKGLRSFEGKKIINDYLLEKHPFVEQVGFVSEDSYELEMAGGEFCGNAARCAIYQYLCGNDGSIKIKINGNYLEGGITNGNVWVTMPVRKGPLSDSVITTDTGSIIHMDGITHVVTEKKLPDKSESTVKEAAFDIMTKLNLLNEPACGVMFIDCNSNSVSLSPVVYVRDIDTLFYETACGSGTTAVGIDRCIKTRSNVDFDVIQPSGETIRISVTYNEDEIGKAVISGKVVEYEY